MFILMELLFKENGIYFKCTEMNKTVVSNIKYRLFVVSGLRHGKILALSFKQLHMDRLHTVGELQCNYPLFQIINIMNKSTIHIQMSP